MMGTNARANAPTGLANSHSMSPGQILIRGPYLVITKGGEFKEVRLPHADPALLHYPAHPENDGKHPDGSGARIHNLGVLVTNQNLDNGQRFKAINGRTITISDAAGGDCKLVPSFDDILPVRRLVSGIGVPRLTLKQWPACGGTKVVFKGGELGSANLAPAEFIVDNHFDSNAPRPRALPLHACWTPKQLPVTIEVEGNPPLTLDTGSGESAFVYNFDDPSNPDADTLLHPTDKTAIGDTDDDFKWIYQLLQPPTSWDDWFDGYPHLPAPVLIGRSGIHTRAADVSTCFGGVWDGD